MPRDKNDFLKTTRETLAKRAGQICSNPDCNTPTSGPHSDDSKAIDVGEAAHIRGARPQAARYDPDMLPLERSDITNGIWLCRTCAKLIDNDEEKYTVEVLYQWKRQRERQRELEIGKPGWQREIAEKNLKLFENESAAAQQIVLDKPKNWEALLTLELLRSKLRIVKREFSDLERGLIYRQSTILDRTQFIAWIRQKADDLKALVKLLKVAVTEELFSPLAFGNPGKSGDAFEIKRAVDKVVLGCTSLLEWEIDLRFKKFPDDDLDNIRQIMQGWTAQYLLEIDKIPQEIAKPLNEPSFKGIHQINLVFKAPENADEVIAELDKLSGM